MFLNNKGDCQCYKTAFYALLYHSISTDMKSQQLHSLKYVFQKEHTFSVNVYILWSCKSGQRNNFVDEEGWRLQWPKLYDFNADVTTTLLETQKVTGTSAGWKTIVLAVFEDYRRIRKAKIEEHQSFRWLLIVWKWKKLRLEETVKGPSTN